MSKHALDAIPPRDQRHPYGLLARHYVCRQDHGHRSEDRVAFDHDGGAYVTVLDRAFSAWVAVNRPDIAGRVFGQP